MSDLQLRARSTTELVDAAVQLYRRDALRYMLLAALAYAPYMLLQLAMLGGAGETGPVGGTLAIVSFAATMIAFALMSAVLARLAGAAYLGEHREIEETVREVVPRIGAVILSTIVKYLLFLVGLLAFIVGGFYVMVRYFATTQAIVLEGVGTREAFARSTALSKGLKRHLFNTLMLVWIIYFVIGMAAALLSAPAGELATAVVSALVTVVAYPVVAIVEVLLYYDARVRQEGYDIEVMAESLPGSPAGVA
jgi:hypothetical protein